MQKYTVTVIGLVERIITVEADSLEHAEHAAECEWAAMTGGIIQTALVSINEPADSDALFSYMESEASTAIEEAE